MLEIAGGIVLAVFVLIVLSELGNRLKRRKQLEADIRRDRYH